MGSDPMSYEIGDFGPVPEPPKAEPTCGHCGKPAQGYATANSTRLCHPDEGMDCYHLVTVYGHDWDAGGRCQWCELPTDTLNGQLVKWADTKAKMKAAWEAEQARIAAMSDEERAAHEAAQERRRDGLLALMELGDEIMGNMTELRLTDPRVAESHGGGACPEQHEGTLTTGEHFYFRYRHGWASLTLGDRPGVYGPPTRYVSSPGFIAEQGMNVGDGLQGIFDDDEQRNSTFSTLLDRLGR